MMDTKEGSHSLCPQVACGGCKYIKLYLQSHVKHDVILKHRQLREHGLNCYGRGEEVFKLCLKDAVTWVVTGWNVCKDTQTHILGTFRLSQFAKIYRTKLERLASHPVNKLTCMPL